MNQDWNGGPQFGPSGFGGPPGFGYGTSYMNPSFGPMDYGNGPSFGPAYCPPGYFAPAPAAGSFGPMPPGPGFTPGFAGGTYPMGYAPPMAPPGYGYGPAGPPFLNNSAPPQYQETGLPTDQEIEEMIYQSFDEDPLIPWDADIDVDSDAGMVTLTGTVSNKRIKHAAGDDAWWIPGVDAIRNEIQVTSGEQSRHHETRFEHRQHLTGQSSTGQTQTGGQAQTGQTQSSMPSASGTTPSEETPRAARANRSTRQPASSSTETEQS